MTPTDRSVALAACLLLVELVGLACSGSKSGTRPSPLDGVLFAPRTAIGVELRAFVQRDTIAVGDRHPVEVSYLIANGDLPTEFNNDPALFFIRVERPGGQPVSFRSSSGPALGSWGPQTRIVLPRYSFLAQTEDLHCVTYGGYAARRTSAAGCLQAYDFDVAGTYYVIVEYYGQTSHAPADSTSEASALKQGRVSPHLADTVALVAR